MRVRRTGARRGTTLIEILVAMAIMAIMMVGVLQMFSLSLLVNKASAARTLMLFRCQQVVENIRYFQYLTKQSPPPPLPANTGIPVSLSGAAGTTISLPYYAADPVGGWDYWGPNGANVMEMEYGPYQISYSIATTPDTGIIVVTVTAQPTTSTSAVQRFLGFGLQSGRRIEYVAQFLP